VNFKKQSQVIKVLIIYMYVCMKLVECLLSNIKLHGNTQGRVKGGLILIPSLVCL